MSSKSAKSISAITTARPTPQQIARAREKREIARNRIIKEKRIMLVSCLGALLGSFLWLAAIGTDQWYLVTNETNNETDLIDSYTGLWYSCRTTEDGTACKYHTLFPNRDEIRRNPSLDEHVIDYRRTSICFALISLLLMVLCLTSAFFTFKNSRYMYKRLAAGLFFITGICMLVVMEVIVTLVTYEKLNVPFNHPVDSVTAYGYSFYMGWTVFLIYFLNFCIFLVFSRKRKGSYACDYDNDTAIEIGR